MSILDGSGFVHNAELVVLFLGTHVMHHLVNAHGNVRVSKLKGALELSQLVGSVTHLSSWWGRHVFRLDGGMLFADEPALIRCRSPFWTLKYGPNAAGDQQTCRMNMRRKVNADRYEYFLRKIAQSVQEASAQSARAELDRTMA